MKTTLTRRMLGLCLAAAGLASAAGAQAQTSYPNRPVRLIVGFPAGTGPDIVARILAQKLSEGWGNIGVIVDNKPGAGGLIAAGEAARATPDGYTLMLGETGQLSIAPSSYNKLPYDPVKDFVPVSQVVSADFVLLVNPLKVPAKNVKEFVSWTQQQKGLFMATFGAGTPGHFGAFMFGSAIKLKLEAIHYRTTADALGGLYSGDTQGVFASVGLAAPQVKAGKLVALGSTGATRTTALPDVPTIKEQGYDNLEFSSWFGVVAPAKIPADILAKLSADIQKAVKAPEGKTKLEDAGFRVTGTTQDEFARIIAADTLTWGKAVAATGFKAD
ncbi:MAG: tripartite tricarboxylate transporter substrate binding protein [Candidatus Saccharibacteria bacterium]|nr:tripartite tricarboxylate transporter substrate binding protein [Rhodoferax sp.]